MESTNNDSPLFLGLDLSTQQLKAIVLERVPLTTFRDHDSNSKTEDTKEEFKVFATFQVPFDSTFPEYGTRDGVIVTPVENNNNNNKNNDKSDSGGGGGGGGGGVVTSPVLMWIAALEHLFEEMQQKKFPFSRIGGISGAGQQHGTVYWAITGQEVLETLNHHHHHISSKKLVTLFSNPSNQEPSFAMEQSPIWQDTSTKKECGLVEEYMGQRYCLEILKQIPNLLTSHQIQGQDYLSTITGSCAFERFSGSQILKIRQQSPKVYQETVRISLVSSFLCSLLVGKITEIDMADGSGMNLLNIHQQEWDRGLIGFIGTGGGIDYMKDGNDSIDYENDVEEQVKKLAEKDLLEKLGQNVESTGTKMVGNVCRWFVDKYGFRPDVEVITFTGDNPASVLAMQAQPGDAIVSLGTSDTFLFYTRDENQDQPIPSSSPSLQNQSTVQATSTLIHPTDPQGRLIMYCAKNGSLARQRIRDEYAQGDWEQFSNYLNQANNSNKPEIEQGNDDTEKLGFYFFDREIWPPIQGIFRFENGKRVQEFSSGDKKDELAHHRTNVIKICESQFLAMKARGLGLSLLSFGEEDDDQPPSESKQHQHQHIQKRSIKKILATGGASNNVHILQVLANVFGVPVEQTAAKSAAWGAAWKAARYSTAGSGRKSPKEGENNGPVSKPVVAFVGGGNGNGGSGSSSSSSSSSSEDQRQIGQDGKTEKKVEHDDHVHDLIGSATVTMADDNETSTDETLRQEQLGSPMVTVQPQRHRVAYYDTLLQAFLKCEERLLN